MAMLIRRIRPEDYAAVAECNRAAMPGTDDTAESLLEDDEHTAANERWVVESNGQVVGSAAWFQLANRLHPRKFWMDIAVHPDFQSRGFGAALFQTVVVAITPKEPISIRTFSREDYAGTLRFLDKLGFVEVKRTWESFLDLGAADLAPYAGLQREIESYGIQIRQLTELQGLTDWDQRLLDLYNAIQTDVPDIDPAAAVDMAYFQEHHLGAKSFIAQGQFIAMEGDRWIGLTNLRQGYEMNLMESGVTGVLPDYRRRKIALALKVRAHEWARQQGITRIRTSNASSNKGMLAINATLGFEPRLAWLHLLLQLEQELPYPPK